MPITARAPCLVQSCPERQPCPVHRPNSALGWRQDAERVRGRKLQALRLELFAREPFCRLCRTAGHQVIATIRDHIQPLAEGGTEAPDNIQPLCRECSDAKTGREAKRGQTRNR